MKYLKSDQMQQLKYLTRAKRIEEPRNVRNTSIGVHQGETD
jgi:hypothetical protein